MGRRRRRFDVAAAADDGACPCAAARGCCDKNRPISIPVSPSAAPKSSATVNRTVRSNENNITQKYYHGCGFEVSRSADAFPSAWNLNSGSGFAWQTRICVILHAYIRLRTREHTCTRMPVLYTVRSDVATYSLPNIYLSPSFERGNVRRVPLYTYRRVFH